MEFHEVLLLIAMSAFLIGAVLGRWAFVGFLALLGIAYVAWGFIASDWGRDADDFTRETLMLFLLVVSGSVSRRGRAGDGAWEVAAQVARHRLIPAAAPSHR